MGRSGTRQGVEAAPFQKHSQRATSAPASRAGFPRGGIGVRSDDRCNLAHELDRYDELADPHGLLHLPFLDRLTRDGAGQRGVLGCGCHIAESLLTGQKSFLPTRFRAILGSIGGCQPGCQLASINVVSCRSVAPSVVANVLIFCVWEGLAVALTILKIPVSLVRFRPWAS